MKNTNTISSRTFRCDLVRDTFQGIIESGILTFLLLIAKRVFDAPDWLKASIQASENFGLFFNTISLAFFAKHFRYANSAWAFCLYMTGIFFILSASYKSLAVYALFVILAKTIYKQKEPLVVEIYSANYSKSERGKRYSLCLTCAALTGMFMAHFGGKALDVSIDNYRYLCLIMGFAGLAAGVAVSKMPKCKIKTYGSTHPFKNISLLWKDKYFGYMKLGWVLLGFGNLMTIPMRTEYLCDANYGINVSNTTAAAMLFVIPAVAKICSMPLWGFLFDKYSFLPVRITLNALWIIGLVLFFNFKSLILLGIGSACIGLAMGGGFLVWTLWVIQIAPENKVTAYMSAHTAIAGLRGLISPFLAYYLLSSFKNVVIVGWIGITLTSISTIVFISAKNR